MDRKLVEMLDHTLEYMKGRSWVQTLDLWVEEMAKMWEHSTVNRWGCSRVETLDLWLERNLGFVRGRTLG